MRGQRSLGQYRAIDLAIFAALLAAFEFLLSKAGTVWFSAQAYVVSLAPLLTAVVMMRWGAWGAIHAALGGVLTALLYGGDALNCLVYGGGNLFGLVGLILLKKPGWRKIQGSAAWTLAYGAAVTLGMQTGRGLISFLLDGQTSSLLLAYTADVVTTLFTLVALWVVRRLDGVFENQKHYIRRVHKEILSEGEGGSE